MKGEDDIIKDEEDTPKQSIVGMQGSRNYKKMQEWLTTELNTLRALLKQYGKNYGAISQIMTTKTQQQIAAKVTRWIQTIHKRNIKEEDPELYHVLKETQAISSKVNYKRDLDGNLIYKKD